METIADIGEGAGPMRATRDDRRQLKSYIGNSIASNKKDLTESVADDLTSALKNQTAPGKIAADAQRNDKLSPAAKELAKNTAEHIKVSNAMKHEIEQHQFQKEELDHLQGSMRQFFKMSPEIQPPRSEPE